MATPVVQSQRRSTRANLGRNGRAVQLSQLGERLVASTRQKKKRFAPEDGLALQDNILAPPKKKRRSKKSLAQPQFQLPAVQPQPCQKLPDDGNYGFQPSSPDQQAVTHSLTTPTGSSYQPLCSPHMSLPSLHSPPSLNFQAPQTSLPSPIEPSDSEADNEAEGADIELEINEQSDDEEDRQAHAFLQASSNPVTMAAVSQSHAVIPRPLPSTGQGHLGFANFGPDESVLQNHYDRNRPPHAPRFQPVCTTPSSRKPLPLNNTNLNVRTLESYPPQWQQVILRAKLAFRAYLAGQCGFPDGVTGVDEARECLEDAVEVHLEEGGTLEADHRVNKNMAMIHAVLTKTPPKVFSESWQLRSQLKADIRVQVCNLKSLFPDNGTRLPRPPHEVRASIQERISRWTADGSYLHDIIPNSGEQVHFSHPIIASTCKSFYFNRWSEISAFDRDTFQGSVPKPLVALVGAIYRNVLDEWSGGSPSTVKLESARYSKVYNAILDSIGIVDQDSYYGPLLHQRLMAWAGFGESINSSHASADIPVNIHLNLRPPSG